MATSNLRVAVVCGGDSAEASVSETSGRCVAEALAPLYDVAVVPFDAKLRDGLALHGTQVVFPVLHGGAGEDGTLQGWLEVEGYPYVGCGVKASAVAMDKAAAKAVYRAHRLPVADDVIVTAEGPSPEEICALLGDDVVVKPAGQGSAIGVVFARGAKELNAGLDAAFAFDGQVLVERRVAGREVTAAVLDRDGPEVLAVIEVVTPDGEWYDFKHRYTPGLGEHVIPAPLPPGQLARTAELARRAHVALGCRDLSRTDFVCPESGGEPIVLETNTLPGMTPTSLYPDAARHAGLEFSDLLSYLVERAYSRRVAS